jgi:hypothetical protein
MGNTNNMNGLDSNDIKARFEDKELQFRFQSSETGVVSEVIRHKSNGDKPAYFQKTMKGDFSYWIEHENTILSNIAKNFPETKAVKLIKQITDINNREESVITESAGLDIFTWYYAPIEIENEQRYSNIFFHPILFLNFLKESIYTLYTVNKIGISHCDLKNDQFCIPYKKIKSTENNMLVEIDFSNIKLIDFGFSFWEKRTAIDSTQRIVIATNRNGLKNEIDKIIDYRSDLLIDTIRKYNNSYDQEKLEHDRAILKKINYSVDLFSFGYLLNSLMNGIYSQETQNDKDIWDKLKDKLNNLRDELYSFNDGIIPPYSEIKLPHEAYIHQIENWIKDIEKDIPTPKEIKILFNNQPISVYIKPIESQLISNEEIINNFIELIGADGIITKSEKDMLFKKAIELKISQEAVMIKLRKAIFKNGWRYEREPEKVIKLKYIDAFLIVLAIMVIIFTMLAFCKK